MLYPLSQQAYYNLSTCHAVMRSAEDLSVVPQLAVKPFAILGQTTNFRAPGTNSPFVDLWEVLLEILEHISICRAESATIHTPSCIKQRGPEGGEGRDGWGTLRP